MTGTVEFIQRIRYVEVPAEKGNLNVYAIPETVENVRELVRCKDCRFCPTDIDARQQDDKRYVFCDKGEWRREDFFCADGEKRI